MEINLPYASNSSHSSSLPSSTGETKGAPLSALIEVARTYEPERYLAATLAADPERAALIAIAAFGADLARIPATATQPMIGEIRLQWWRDSLELIGNGARIGSPLADALRDAVEAYALPVPMLVAMTEARAWDLYDDPMPDEASLDGYLSKIESIPFELALRILGVAPGEAASLSAPAGRAFGLARLLVRLPTDLAAGRVTFPVTRMTLHGLDVDAFSNVAEVTSFRPMITETIRDIRDTLATLRPRFVALPRRQRVALLPLAVLSPYLRAIERWQYARAQHVTALAPLRRVWRIAGAHLLGRI